MRNAAVSLLVVFAVSCARPTSRSSDLRAAPPSARPASSVRPAPKTAAMVAPFGSASATAVIPTPRADADAGSSPTPAVTVATNANSATSADAGGFTFVTGTPREFFAHDNDALARYIQQEHMPGYGAHADVAAGSADEWLVDVFQYAFVVSPDVAGFWYRDFGKGDVLTMSAEPLTRGDKKDVVIRYSVNEGESPSGYRHVVMEVWSFGAEGPVLRFASELSVATMCCGSEANAPPHASTTVTFHDAAIDLVADAPWRIDARFHPGSVSGLVPATPPPSILPMLPPDVKRRLYAWDGRVFDMSREERSK